VIMLVFVGVIVVMNMVVSTYSDRCFTRQSASAVSTH